MASSIWQIFGNSAIFLLTIIFTRYDKSRRVNSQSSDRVYGLIVLTFPSYAEKSIMNSLTRYSGRNRVVFSKIQMRRSTIHMGAKGMN